MTPCMATLLSTENLHNVRCVVRGRTAIPKNDSRFLRQMAPITSVGTILEGLTTVCVELERDSFLRPDKVLRALWAN